MIIIPAIDLIAGKVVRLTRGEFAEEKVYSDDPVSVAKTWQSEGAQWVHVVDLDGAKEGQPRNWQALKAILDTVTIPLEFGGGIRDEASIEKTLSLGVQRVVIGTRALEEDWINKMLKHYGDKLAIGLDIRGKSIQTEGWTKATRVEFLEKAKRLEELGAKCLIFTDITRDGTLEGPNLALLKIVLDQIKVKVILSGGVSSLNDFNSLLSFKEKNFEGVIVGKALYEEKFTLKEAIDKVKGV